MKKKATPERTIFAICRALGMTEADRHNLQESMTGKRSLTEMSPLEKDIVIKKLLELQKKANRTRSKSKGTWKNKMPKKTDTVYPLITPDQYSKIQAMSLTIYGSFDEKKLDRFCMKIFKKPLRRLDTDDAIKLIEMQKKILTRKEGEENAKENRIRN